MADQWLGRRNPCRNINHSINKLDETKFRLSSDRHRGAKTAVGETPNEGCGFDNVEAACMQNEASQTFAALTDDAVRWVKQGEAPGVTISCRFALWAMPRATNLSCLRIGPETGP